MSMKAMLINNLSSSSWNWTFGGDQNQTYLTLSQINLYPQRKRCHHLLKGGVVLVIFLALSALCAEACQISEYYCDNRKCVSLDKFCNGIDNCGDGSDEPRHCSPCNRTFYGEVGGTYSIAIHRPSSVTQQSYVCQLTFAAGGSKFGDLVQLIFNSVTLGPGQGRYPSDKPPTCQQGHVTLNEPDRPATAGRWCGHDWGQAVFFSETSRVTLTLSLFSAQSSSSSTNFAFDFRLTYKFLRKVDSAVRYGPPSQPYFRGQLLPGTFCSLIYNSCDKVSCALQTPNFPGIYPRNVTCYYAIRQLAAPVGHRAVIRLAQEKEHMVFVRNRAVSKKNAFVPGDSGGISGLSGDAGGNKGAGSGGGLDELTIGEQCDASSDYVTVFDGYTIRDPVLLRFCGGGKFPSIVSSGNELLMEFYSAPTDYLLQSAVNTAIQGFHVDVVIKYLPLGSHTYVENHKCWFTVSSFQQKRGFLTSPQHSLPSGTTCTYLLEGSPGEIVWISLLKFYIGKEYGKSGDEGGSGGGGSGGGYSVAGLTGMSPYLGGASSTSTGSGGAPSNYMAAMGQLSSMSSLECNTTYFQIWQGTQSDKFNNATLLAHLCEDTPIQRTCEFMLTSTTSSKPPPRACHPDESFISKGPHMSLKLKVETTTVLRPAEFKLYYEFVDMKQDGEPFSHPGLIGHPQNSPNLPKFLRTEQQGNPVYEDIGGGGGTSNSIKFPVESCSRIFKSTNNAMQAATFTSPRNVFYFGRGGVTNLTCVYRFQGVKGQRVRVTFNKISLAGGFCKSEVNLHSGRHMCRDITQNDTQSTKHRVTQGMVQVWEVPWAGNDSRILKECLCEINEGGPFSFLSVSSSMDIVLSVKNMQPFHDQDHFTFEGSYEFIKHPGCSRSQKVKASTGSITLKQPEKVPFQSCSNYPWEIQPASPSHYIYLRVPGRTMKKFVVSSSSYSSKSKSYSTSTSSSISTSQDQELATHCDTRNRIHVYSGGFSGHLLEIICPEDSSSGSSKHIAEIFSVGWESPQEFPNFVENPHLSMTNLPSNNQLIVELVSRGPSSNARYELKYLQISRRDEPLDWGVYGSSSSSSSTTGVLSGSSVITTSGGNIIGIDGGHKIVTPGDAGSSSQSSGATSSSSIVSSRDELEDDVCFKFKCPELNACISPSLFCDGEIHCPSGYDEAECEYFPIPKTYLVLAAASLITFLVLSCCFGCLVCKKRRAERREKLLMSSRTPTEEMFFGTGTGTMSMGSGGGGAGLGGSHAHHLHHHHHREIVC